MEYKDYYKIMGVERNATPEDIKRAHRRLARKYHPDINRAPEAEGQFKELGEAYEVLKDPEKRAAYDQVDPNSTGGQGFRPPPGWNPDFGSSGGGFTGSGSGDYSDFFEALFGYGFAAGRPGTASHQSHGQDRHARIVVDLEDSYNGATRMIVLQEAKMTPEGNPFLGDRKLNVTIPKGVRPGQHIRLVGQGSQGVGSGKPGDLYLEIEFRPNPRYQVSGPDVTLELPVAPWEAALGGDVNVPTPGGTLQLRVPPGSSSGDRLRLKGRGIPGKIPGDLYILLRIVTPPADSEKEKEMYRKLAEEFQSFEPRAQAGA